jgi:hypothetical protein
MIPKNTANELYESMFYVLNHTKAIFFDLKSKDECAKQCAIITADEVLNNLDTEFPYIIEYWKEVKQEIEKI